FVGFAYVDIDADTGWRCRIAEINYQLTFRLEYGDMGWTVIIQADHDREPILLQRRWHAPGAIKALRLVKRLTRVPPTDIPLPKRV
ncbi:MAG: hypothetical protein R6W76_12730, partial [Caldilinea sp.]